MAGPAIRFEGVSKSFRKGESATALRDLFPSLLRRIRGRGPAERKGLFWALRDVSFEVQPGEVLGLIGANGAGKSTALKLVAGILRPNAGSVEVNGSLSALIEVGAGFHPDLTGRENIFLNASLLGLRRRDVRKKLDEIIDFAELREFIDTPVKRYSSGMFMRLGFSVAVHVDPQILLIDEVLAVGDMGFRHKCMERMKALRSGDKAILFVSHKMSDVRGICDRVLYLKNGRIEQQGPAMDVSRAFEEDMKGKSIREFTARAASQKGEATVRILNVRVLDESGLEVGAVNAEDGFTVRAEIDALQAVADPVLSVALVRADNVRVCHATTFHLGARIPEVVGPAWFEMEFSGLDLVGDHFLVETMVWNREMNIPLAQFLNPPLVVRDRFPAMSRPGVFHPRALFRWGTAGKGVVGGED